MENIDDKIQRAVAQISAVNTKEDLLFQEKSLLDLVFLLGYLKNQKETEEVYFGEPDVPTVQEHLQTAAIHTREDVSPVPHVPEAEHYAIPAATQVHHQTEAERVAEENKLRLSRIKGLSHSTPTLAENEPVGSFSVPAQKPPAAISFTLNDRIAIQKVLYRDNSLDFQQDITHLTSLQSKEDAKEFLSQRYYEREWQGNDEVAQRFWAIVEQYFDAL